jgi:hypothetical protein
MDTDGNLSEQNCSIIRPEKKKKRTNRSRQFTINQNCRLIKANIEYKLSMDRPSQ